MAGERGKAEEEKNNYLGVWVKKMLGFLLLVTLKRCCFKPHINFNISSKTALFYNWIKK